MQFKNPLILYALFLLLIPVVVHLFQLRKFKKTRFSNVAFLKSVTQNTRKSAHLKKWLILFTRLLAMTAFIFAFAQPFIPQSQNATLAREHVIFLDNSFSMQAKGTKGPLLKQAVQELIKNQNYDFTLLTYSDIYPSINIEKDQNTLLNISYSPVTLTADELALKIGNAFSGDPGVVRELLVISDFKDLNTQPLRNLKNLNQHWVHLKPASEENSYIDAVELQNQDDTYQLTATIKNNLKTDKNSPISLYNGKKLVSRATASFKDSTSAKVDFRIEGQNGFQGRVHLDDAALSYDNDFYFNLDTAQPIQVLSINASPDDYLRRLYDGDGFNYAATAPEQLSYDQFTDKQVVILNELKEIPTSLITALQSFTKKGGKLILIPNPGINATVYQNLLSAYEVLPYGERVSESKSVTGINYDNPLFRNVFERRTANFQYPKATETFPLRGGSALLTYADGSPFLMQQGDIFVFSAGLESSNSNFQDSPLIVPTFGEMARSALSPPRPYYFLGDLDNSFDIKSKQTGDDVYSLRMNGESFIPMQEKKGGTVKISTQQGLEKAGIYNVIFKDSIVAHVAYNYKRNESRPANSELKTGDDIPVSGSIAAAISEVQEASSITALYKWFVIFALLFLLSEMLILKFWK